MDPSTGLPVNEVIHLPEVTKVTWSMSRAPEMVIGVEWNQDAKVSKLFSYLKEIPL
jgi:hypothetical protein